MALVLSRRVGAELSGVLAAARRERGVAHGVAAAEALKAGVEAEAGSVPGSVPASAPGAGRLPPVSRSVTAPHVTPNCTRTGAASAASALGVRSLGLPHSEGRWWRRQRACVRVRVRVRACVCARVPLRAIDQRGVWRGRGRCGVPLGRREAEVALHEARSAAAAAAVPRLCEETALVLSLLGRVKARVGVKGRVKSRVSGRVNLALRVAALRVGAGALAQHGLRDQLGRTRRTATRRRLVRGRRRRHRTR